MKRSPVTNKPYLNEAIIGNGSMLAALGATGELYRLWWPHLDMPQHVEQMKTGIFMQDATEETVWLDQEEAWDYSQSYIPRSNVLISTATGKRHPITVCSTDFVLPNRDVLVRTYRFTNFGKKDITIRFFAYSSFTITENKLYNTVAFEPKIDGLLYFRHQYVFAVSSAIVCTGYAIDHAFHHASSGYLPGDTIGMVPHGALSYRLEIKAGETATLPLYTAAASSIAEAIHMVNEVKSVSEDSLLAETLAYWQSFVRELPPLTTSNALVQSIYERSLLVFALMTDKVTGSVIAAPEFDEAFTRCGGYAYCWGRDAAYIATAFDKTGLTRFARQFYRWALLAQDSDGSWQQRHFHDGRLAPSWGLQIDEGASILWGMHQHYLTTEDRSFLKEIWAAVEKGANFLISYIDQKTGLPSPSRDLWEERLAEHTYSAAAVHGGLIGAASIARTLGHSDQAACWEEAALRMKQAIESRAYNPRTNTFYRGLKLQVTKQEYEQAIREGRKGEIMTDGKGYQTYSVDVDPTYDISLLGLSVPFDVLDVTDPRMIQTANAIEKTCVSPLVGGIKRYEDDRYIGGNPWILTTLWLAQFRIKEGRMEEAKKHFEWAATHATSLHLLPEQIDKQTGKTAWAIPLTWSHAMFVLTARMLEEAGQLNG